MFTIVYTNIGISVIYSFSQSCLIKPSQFWIFVNLKYVNTTNLKHSREKINYLISKNSNELDMCIWILNKIRWTSYLFTIYKCTTNINSFFLIRMGSNPFTFILSSNIKCIPQFKSKMNGWYIYVYETGKIKIHSKTLL